MSAEGLFILLMLGFTALLILGNALFVFHEFAFVVLKPFQIRRLASIDTWLARSIVKAARRIDHYIAVDQLGITATSIGVGWVGQPVVTRLLRVPFENVEQFAGIITVATFALAFTLLTMIQMVFGELIPKTIALRHPQRVASVVVAPVEATARLLHPIVVILNGLGNLAVRAIGVEPRTEGHSESLPAEELELVIARSAATGRVQVSPVVLRHTLHFSDLEARDLIVPRQDMVVVDLAFSVDEVLEMAREHHFTRYPVSDGSADNIVGILNVKDLFQIDPDNNPVVVRDWQKTIRPVPALPEIASIEQVLKELVDNQEQMLVLVDEFGGTSGLLTVADIASEFTGSSEDIVQLADNWYSIAGETPISTVELMLGLELDQEKRDYETIAGLVMSVLGRIPSIGEEIQVDGATLRVHRMTRHRITYIHLHTPREESLDE